MRTAQNIEAQSSAAGTQSSTRKKAKLTPEMEVRKWKPGQSGNPTGRNGKDVAQEIAKAIFTQNPELIYQAFSSALKKGNAYAFQVLSDRAFGKLKETKEVTHKYEEVPDGDLQHRIDQLMKDLGLAQQVDSASKIAQDVLTNE